MALYTCVGGVNRELREISAGVGGATRKLGSLQGCVDGVNRELLLPPKKYTFKVTRATWKPIDLDFPTSTDPFYDYKMDGQNGCISAIVHLGRDGAEFVMAGTFDPSLIGSRINCRTDSVDYAGQILGTPNNPTSVVYTGGTIELVNLSFANPAHDDYTDVPLSIYVSCDGQTIKI